MSLTYNDIVTNKVAGSNNYPLNYDPSVEEHSHDLVNSKQILKQIVFILENEVWNSYFVSKVLELAKDSLDARKRN